MHEFFSIELSLAQNFFCTSHPLPPLRKFSNIPSLKMCELNNEYVLLTCFVNH